MDCGSEQSFVVNRVATSGDTIPKISPDRASTKSHSTSSSSSAIGGHEKKMPFLIGVAGGTASGKVVNCKPSCYKQKLKLFLSLIYQQILNVAFELIYCFPDVD